MSYNRVASNAIIRKRRNPAHFYTFPEHLEGYTALCTGSHPFIPAPGVVNVQLIFDQFSQKMENVYNVVSGGGTTVADLDRIQAKFYTWLTATWKGMAHTSASCALMILRDMSVEAGVGKEYIILPAQAGTQIGGSLPSGLTVAIKWSTGHVGRSFRGRTFHVGLPVGFTTNNAITTAAQTNLATGYAALRTGLLAGGTADVLSVVSYCHDKAWRPTAVATAITGCSVDLNVDSQRRRLNNRGT